MSEYTKRPGTVDDQSSEDEEGELEMERNFSLLSQRQTLVVDDEDEAAEDDDGEDGAAEESDEEEPEPEKDEGSSSTHQSTHVNKRLSTMTFEELVKLQNKVGTKVYNKMAYGDEKGRRKDKPMKRLNKHRPQEISAKHHVPFLRKVVPVKKKVARDPRFDDLSGEYKPGIFNQTYRFIDDLREKEKQVVKKKLKVAKSEAKKEELKGLLKRMENQQKARQRQEQEREKEIQFKKKQRELVGQGHKPFYLKKSDQKKMELAEKYTELKKSGKLDNFLSKKRKRNATKDRRKLPNPHKTR